MWETFLRKTPYSVQNVVQEKPADETERCTRSRPQLPRPTLAMPGTMTPPLCDQKQPAFFDSGFRTEA